MFLKNNMKALFSVMFILTLSSCWSSGNKQSADIKKTGLVVINVLDKEDFEDCHIKGSINIPFIDIEQNVPKMVEPGATIVLYCSNYMCSASGAARDMLLKMGYKDVYAYEGGTAEWFQKGLPVEGPCKKAYLSVKMQEPEENKASGIIKADELKKKLEENKNI